MEKAMEERLKIEDMTLGQIKDLKKEISGNIALYLHDIVKTVNKNFDLGDIDISVRTDIDEVFFESVCDTIKRIEYKSTIKFSREQL